MSDRPKDLPPLDANRIAEIRNLLTYESSISFQSARAHESMWMLHDYAERLCHSPEPAGHHLIHSEAFVDQGEPVASTSEYAPDKPTFDQAALDREMGDSIADPEMSPEQDLRGAIVEILADVDHFAGCNRWVEGDGRCTCLVGRLDWAVNTEQVTEPAQNGAA